MSKEYSFKEAKNFMNQGYFMKRKCWVKQGISTDIIMNLGKPVFFVRCKSLSRTEDDRFACPYSWGKFDKNINNTKDWIFSNPQIRGGSLS